MRRYDVRNRLEDKNQFGLKSNLPHRPTAEEVELEEELDYERYLALERDDLRVAEQEGKEEEREGREREQGDKLLLTHLPITVSTTYTTVLVPPPQASK